MYNKKHKALTVKFNFSDRQESSKVSSYNVRLFVSFNTSDAEMPETDLRAVLC